MPYSDKSRPVTPDELRVIASTLREIADGVDAVANRLDSASLDTITLTIVTAEDYIKALRGWLRRTQGTTDTRIDELRAAGVRSSKRVGRKKK